MHIDLIDKSNQLTEEQTHLLYKLLQYTAKKENVSSESELSVVIVLDAEIKRLNKSYRHKDEVTDVLSFPLLGEDGLIQYEDSYPQPLGDIVISIERVRAQAEAYHHSFMRELAFLAVHGLLHLLGYTHDSKEEEKEMFTKQESVLKEFNLERER